MLLDIQLKHFRSYTDDSFEFDPGVNIIVGPNASGKTNLLEAILIIARGSSYRAKDGEMIQFDQPWARVDVRQADGIGRTVKMTREPSGPSGKSYEIGGKPYQRLTLNNTVPTVLFEPNHLQLLAGSPDRRREYLDDLLEQIKPGYGPLRRQYRRTLAQRNSLLKRASVPAVPEMFAWNVRLSQLAGQVVRARAGLVADLHSSLPKLYKELSGTRNRVDLKYASKGPVEAYETYLLKRLEADSQLDYQRGFTGAGPHREDLLVTFDGHPAQDVASRGEIRTAVLALKIGELQQIEAARDTTPLLLLDDVFSELDGKRRHALTDHLKRYQTFITTTDADVVLQHFTAAARTIALGR